MKHTTSQETTLDQVVAHPRIYLTHLHLHGCPKDQKLKELALTNHENHEKERKGHGPENVHDILSTEFD